MKRCSHCHTTENLMPKAYSRTKSGEYYMCRPCNTERAKRYRETGHGAQRCYEAVTNYRRNYPEKWRAYALLKYAIHSGRVDRPDVCDACHNPPNDGKPVDGHHFDYNLPLVVIWLDRQCHADAHNGSLDIKPLIAAALERNAMAA